MVYDPNLKKPSLEHSYPIKELLPKSLEDIVPQEEQVEEDFTPQRELAKEIAQEIFKELQQPEAEKRLPKEWQLFLNDRRLKLEEIAKESFAAAKQGRLTWQEEKNELEAISIALKALDEKAQQVYGSDLNQKEFAIIHQNLQELQQKVERLGKLIPLYNLCDQVRKKKDDALENLNKQIEELEVGEGSFNLDSYKQLLQILPEIQAVRQDVEKCSEPRVRRELLKTLQDAIQSIRFAREDFFEQLRENYEVELIEAEERLHQAQKNPEKKSLHQASIDIALINEEYQTGLRTMQQIEKELALTIGPAPAVESRWKQPFQLAKGFAHALLHPIETLKDHPEEEAADRSLALGQEMQALLKEVVSDRTFLQGLAEKSQHLTSEIALPEAAIRSKEEPITAAGRKRAGRYQKARKHRADWEKAPDERYRIALNRIFLGMQLLSGVQWFANLSSQAEMLRQKADQMSLAASRKQFLEKGTPEQQVELEQHLLIIEALLKGLYEPSGAEFKELQQNHPSLARYIQDVAKSAQPPFARAFSDEGLQQQLNQYIRGYVVKAAPLKVLSIKESLQKQWTGTQEWLTDFTTPTLTENVALAQLGPQGVQAAIAFQGHLVQSALEWQGNPSENPFLQQLSTKHPTTAAWIQRWTGKAMQKEAIQEIRDFYERATLNSYRRFLKAAEATTSKTFQAEPTHLIVPLTAPPEEAPKMETEKTFTSASAKTSSIFDSLSYAFKWLSVALSGAPPSLPEIKKTQQAQEELVEALTHTKIKLPADTVQELKTVKAEIKGTKVMLTNVVNSVEKKEREEFLKKTHLKQLENFQILSKIQATAKQRYSFVQFESLMESPAEEVSDTLFQHVLGGHFGQGTGLEGGAPEIMLRYVMQMAAKKMEAMQQNPLCGSEAKDAFCRSLLQWDKAPKNLFQKLQDQLNKAQELRDAFTYSPHAFIDKFQKNVADLKIGDSFFFQGGWNHQEGGHAIVYEAIKESEGFTFRIYNRGAGDEYSATAVLEGKLQNLSFVEIMGVSQDKLTSPIFLRALQELNSAPVRGDTWKPADLYERIIPLLGGTYSHRLYDAEQAMEILQVGHCSYLALTALISQHLGDRPTYSRWELEVQFKTLMDYEKGKRAQFDINEQARRLLKEGTAQFGRNVEEAFKAGIVHAEEIVWIKEQVASVERSLVHAEESYQNAVKEQAPKVNLQPVPSSSTPTLIDLPPVLGKEVAKRSEAPPYTSVDRSSWRYQPDTFLKDLASLQNEVAEARSSGQIFLAKEGIKEFIRLIPLEGDVFWKSMSLEQAREAMQGLAAISKEYLWVFIKGAEQDPQRRDHHLYTEDFLAQAKILTLADAGLRHFKEALGFEFSGLYDPRMAFVIHETSVHSQTYDPRWSAPLMR